MQLSYRGTLYEVQNPAIEVTETNQVGLFLGKRFKIKQLQELHHPSTPAHLKYRGVNYQA